MLPLLVLALAAAGAGASHGQPHVTTTGRIVTLLQGLQERLKDDGRLEQDAYDKVACDCGKAATRIAKAITDGRKTMKDYGGQVETQTGKVATFAGDLEQHMEDLRLLESGQVEAAEQRRKQHEARRVESAEALQAIESLRGALAMLGGCSMSELAVLQRGGGNPPAKHVAAAATVADSVLGRLIVPAPTGGFAALRVAANTASSSVAAGGSRTPQCGTIHGILQELLKQLDDGEKAAAQEEATHTKSFEELDATTRALIDGLHKQVREVRGKDADAQQALATAKVVFSNADEQLVADVALFNTTKTGCEKQADAWRERQALRTAERSGITKALELLTSDESRELLARATGADEAASLLQVVPGTRRLRGKPAAMAEQSQPSVFSMLRRRAAATHSMRLARVANKVRRVSALNFDAVLAVIKTQIEALEAEAQTDITKRDECKSQLHAGDLEIRRLEWVVKGHSAGIQKHNRVVDKLAEDLIAAESKKARVKKTLEDLGNEKEANSQMLKDQIEDGNKAAELLGQAIDFLKAALPKSGDQIAGTEKEQDTGTGETTGTGLSGAVALLENIKEDLEHQKQLAGKAVLDGQDAFDNEKDSLDKIYDALLEAVSKLGEAKADAKVAAENSETAKEGAETEVKNNAEELSIKKQDCKFIGLHFDERRKRRAAEIDGLRSARDQLVGQYPSATTAEV